MTDNQMVVATFLATFGYAIHLGVDLLLQNEWMANNKQNLKHIASYTHSGLHFLGLLLIFKPWVAAIIALLHLLIDTRIPLKFWSRIITLRQDQAYTFQVSFWRDQALHLVIIAIFSLVQATH